jgi:hypothetical protein
MLVISLPSNSTLQIIHYEKKKRTSISFCRKSRLSHSTNEDPTPNKYITPDPTNTTDSSPKLTEEYIVWREADRLLRDWLIGTLSEETLGLVVSPNLAFAI